MSKSVIVVTTANGKEQYFRSENSEADYMGKMLESFAASAAFLPNPESGNGFCYLLGMEKGSAPERTGTAHGGVGSCWYVEIGEAGFDISWTEIEDKTFDGLRPHLAETKGEKNCKKCQSP